MKIFETKNISRLIILSLIFIISSNLAVSQKDSTTTDDGMNPVRSPWTASMIIDNQTTEGPNKGAFAFAIHHRFGKMKEISDLFGIYAASNIRLGINYGITDKLSVGFGTEKNNKMQEFQAKYTIFKQTRNGKMPVSLAYFGNVVIDSRNKDLFGSDYEFTNRLSFFNQVIVSRKFTKALSLQFAGSFTHFNAVTETGQNSAGQDIGMWKNDYVGLMIAGRYKFYNNISAIFEYCYPIAINEVWEGQNEPLPNLGIGVEFGTSTHAFQVFAAQYDGIVAQKNYAHNLNDMAFEGWHMGFNITVKF